MLKQKWYFLLMLLLPLGFAACDDDDDDNYIVISGNIWNAVQDDQRLSTLESAIDAADLEGSLQNGNATLTVFAPVNSAFASLPEGTLNMLLADPSGLLKQVLLYHVVDGQYAPSQLKNGTTLTSLNGATLAITHKDGRIRVNNTAISEPIYTSNGVVYLIDEVLIPPADIWDVIEESTQLSTLETAIEAANLEDALEDESASLTVFAPVNSAFAALPAGTLEALLADPTGKLTQILLYHAVNGEYAPAQLKNGMTLTTLNGATLAVTQVNNTLYVNNVALSAPIYTTNGIIYMINSVLLPPSE
ncbi:MAG: fasciclin domain-containing protein [Bacteroidales bacterium]